MAEAVQQALPSAIQILSRVTYAGVAYARGRVIAPPDQATYDVWRREGKCADTTLPVDNMVLNQGTTVGSFTAFWNDSAGRLYPAGSSATIAAADAAVARREGKIDAAIGTAPAISAVAAAALGGGQGGFTFRVDQASSCQVQYGPTTAYGTNTPWVNVPANQTAQWIVASGMPLALTHYRVVAANMWGTTNGADLTFTPT
jgi:hypothetical protein